MQQDMGTLFSKARPVLVRATELDRDGDSEQAYDHYVKGIDLLFEKLNDVKDEATRDIVRKKVDEYMSRAETLKSNSKKSLQLHLVAQHEIKEGSTGHSYERIFRRCLDEKVTSVVVEDPYIRELYQIRNFVTFCELLVLHCHRLRRVKLVTGRHPNNSNSNVNQQSSLEELRNSLNSHAITMSIEYKDFHDRRIRFDNGWVVKLGRGLDIYKRVPEFSIGRYNTDLRPCSATTIDFFKLQS